MAKNEKWFRFLKFGFMVLVMLLGVVAAYATLRANVKDNTEDIQKVTITADTNKIDVVEIKTDIKYIKKGIDDIKQKLK